MAKSYNGWTSVHEELPPANEMNEANSIAVLWCNAEADNPEYAQYVGRLWYGDPNNRLNPPRFDSGSLSLYLFDVNTGEPRDLYWRYLPELPQPVKR